MLIYPLLNPLLIKTAQALISPVKANQIMMLNMLEYKAYNTVYSINTASTPRSKYNYLSHLQTQHVLGEQSIPIAKAINLVCASRAGAYNV